MKQVVRKLLVRRASMGDDVKGVPGPAESAPFWLSVVFDQRRAAMTDVLIEPGIRGAATAALPALTIIYEVDSSGPVDLERTVRRYAADLAVRGFTILAEEAPPACPFVLFNSPSGEYAEWDAPATTVPRIQEAILFRDAEGRVLDVQWAGPRRVVLVIDWTVPR